MDVGADLGALLLASLDSSDLTLTDRDVVVITHKVVSKAEGAIRQIDPGDEDAEYRRVVLDEAAEVIRVRGDLIIAKTAHGFICANAGVDRSNARPLPGACEDHPGRLGEAPQLSFPERARRGDLGVSGDGG